MSLRRRLINFLLALLNSRWLNGTPAYYGFINGLDAISYGELCNEEKQQPGITVREVIAGIDRFRSCPMNGGLMVIEGDTTRPATAMDVHELRQSLTAKKDDR